MNAIEISHVTKDYGEGKGVFDVSFDVRQGEVMGFLGPNGAGKTTTIRQLLGFIRPDSGYLHIFGKDCFLQADEIAKSLGYLPGEIAFIDSMNAEEFIGFVARMKGMKSSGRAKELQERFELNPHGKIKRMSKGMKQKLGIICAFMQDPDILILDEPTSGLDPLMQNAFVELILEEKKRGKTILMSSHIFEEIEKTCDRAAIIRRGRLLSVESIENLKNSKRKTIELELDTPAAARQLAGQLPVSLCANLSTKDNRVTVTVSGSMDTYLKIFSQYHVLDMNFRTSSLEELFMHFYNDIPVTKDRFLQ